MAVKHTLSEIPRAAASRTWDYLGIQEPGGVSPLRQALDSMDIQERIAVVNEPRKFRETLQDKGVPEIVTARLCLLRHAENFSRLTSQTDSLSRLDLEEFLRHAVRSTGLQRAVVMGLVSDITGALHTACQIAPSRALRFLERDFRNSDMDGAAFTVPFSCYRKELDDIYEEFQAWRDGGPPMENGTLKRLGILCAIGIPEAQYYMGYYLRQLDAGPSRTDAGEHDYALELLKKAAYAGNADAAAELGDYYYRRGIPPGESDCWGRALSYYTGYGAPALNRERRQAVLAILNRKRRNVRILQICTAFSALLPVLAVLIRGSSFIETLAGIFSGLFALAACGLFAVRRSNLPYDSLRPLPVLVGLAAAFWFTVRMLR